MKPNFQQTILITEAADGLGRALAAELAAARATPLVGFGFEAQVDIDRCKWRDSTRLAPRVVTCGN